MWLGAQPGQPFLMRVAVAELEQAGSSIFEEDYWALRGVMTELLWYQKQQGKG